jgi:hypothetical protein
MMNIRNAISMMIDSGGIDPCGVAYHARIYSNRSHA